MSMLAYHLSGLNYFRNTALIRWKATAWQNTILTKRYSGAERPFTFLFRRWPIKEANESGCFLRRKLTNINSSDAFFPHSTVREPSGRLEAELNM